MVEQIIEADVVYNHEKHGEVLVAGISKMYDEWDTAGPREDIQAGEVLVFFYTSFDGYGGMQPTPSTENVNDFAKRVSRDRLFEYEQHSELRVDNE